MASYLDIKNVLKEIFCLETEMDETCDISICSRGIGETGIVIKNSELKNAYDNANNYSSNNLEFYSKNSYEIAVQQNRLSRRPNPIIDDSINGLHYSLGNASIEYFLFFLIKLCENDNRKRLTLELRIRFRNMIRFDYYDSCTIDLLPTLFRIKTLKVKSDKSDISLSKLQEHTKAFEFMYMYKQGVAIHEYKNIEEMFSLDNSFLRFSREELDSPPQRIYNADILEYYAMGMESTDPFTMYISFYHVIEYYFDAVYKKNLINNIKHKITSPDFSYKDEAKIYDLAKYIKKHMNSDTESGKGNEFESLKYVLIEYVHINDLRDKINDYKLVNTDYYKNTKVPFATSKDTRISWSNSEGVFTNLATRIYETRNSLVHSKSDYAANQYKPYENKNELAKEIPLIKSVAELIIINSSQVLE